MEWAERSCIDSTQAFCKNSFALSVSISSECFIQSCTITKQHPHKERKKNTQKHIHTNGFHGSYSRHLYQRERQLFFLDGTPSVNTNKPCIEDFVFSFKDYCWYDNRFRSFCDWPKCHPMKAETLAGAGFHYTGKGDKVECDWCKLVLGW